MRTMQTFVFTAALVLLHVAAADVGLTTQEPSIEEIMQQKLDNAHSLLEALIVEDFETLQDSARTLQRLSEQAAWFVLDTAEYERQSVAFRLAVAEIESSASARNIDGAALGYVEMTLKCVQCHQFLRGTARADALFPSMMGQKSQLLSLTSATPRR